MHREFESISRALQARSPVVIDGTPVPIWLIALREASPRGTAALVVFGGTDSRDTHTCELSVTLERLQDLRYVVEQAVMILEETVRRGSSTQTPADAR